MKMQYFFTAALLLTLIPAHAQDRMLNISASGDVTDTKPQIACTIVEGYREFAVLAEAVTSQTDPYLFITRIDQEDEGQENDDWVDIPQSDKNILSSELRLPNRSTDSAILLWVSNLPICAYAYEFFIDGPAGQVNLQWNDITGAFNRTLPDDTEAGYGLLSVVD